MFFVPKTIRRGNLQYVLLMIWGVGLAFCVFVVFRTVPHLTNKQLDIAPMDLLKRQNPDKFEAIQRAVKDEDWGQLRRRLAEYDQKANYDEVWGRDLSAFRSKLSAETQKKIDKEFGGSDWSDWDRIADALIEPQHLQKIKNAGGDFYLFEEYLLPSDLLSSETKQKKNSLRGEYEKILIALCAPWITVMVSTVLFGSQTMRRQKIRFGAGVVVCILSVFFLVGIGWSFCSSLYGPSDTSASPQDLIDPILAFAATLVGTTVTFIFPEVDGKQNVKPDAPANPAN
jgi:hypothetical protein